MIGLLHLLRDHADAVEADLSRFFNIDYRDRWRYDENGVRKLTLRMIYVRIKALPPEAATSIALNDGRRRWTDVEFLMADVFHGLVGKAHPARPKVEKKADPEFEQAKQEAIRRVAARREAAKKAKESAT